MSEITSQLSTALADRYRIESHLGEGGMATVYLAHDVKHDRKVALKVLRPELAAVIGAERFLQEIKVTANLQHPHILPLHDSGTVGSAGGGAFLYYVMPYVEGETLRDKLDREKQLGIADAVEIAKAVASALDYAHRQGVIHRDIKPENVLMHDGQAMIADFGIALAVSQAGGSRLTETGLSIGTPHYMSPEQAMGDRELDARADVYSLGAMLYEMLAGDPPYQGSTAQAIVAKVITEKAPLLTAARDTVPPNVAAAVHKALEKLPADRFTTAAQFVEALTNPSFSVARTAMAASVAGTTSGPRYLWPGVAAALGVAALVGWLRPKTTPPVQVVRYNMTLAEGQGLMPRFGSRIALSPDASKFVYVGPGAGGVQLWLRERNQLEARPVPGSIAAESPFFSPDGGQLGFLLPAPPTIRIASLAGGPPITLSDSAVGLLGATWSTDGFIYADGATGGLLRIPSGGGPVEAVSTLDTAQNETSHHWPHALPNGKGVLFSVSHGALTTLTQTDIAVLDLSTGTHEILVRGVAARYARTGHVVYVSPDGSLMAIPFDQNSLETTGPPAALVEGIALRLAGSVDFTVSNTGTLAYISGGVAEEPSELVWVDRAGRATQVDPDWAGDFYTPAISPDGTRLAIAIAGQELRDLWIKTLDTGPLSRLTFPADNDHRPWWMDNESLLFISSRNEVDGGNRDLYRRRADGVGQAVLVLDHTDPVNQAFYSPNREWLVFRTGRIDALDILLKRTTGDTAIVPLIADPKINEHSPTLSPDGKWLAYVSDESGDWQLYVRPFPNVNDGRWQISTDGATEPLWAHSGREIFFKDNGGSLLAAEVRSTPTFSVGQRTTLFRLDDYYSYAFHPQYDVARDDQRFLMIRFRNVGEAGNLIFVENWFEELKARFQTGR